MRLLISLATALLCADAQFLSEARLVLVDAQVRDKTTGSIIDLLGQEDFLIFDEGEAREIKVFEVGTTPLDVVFLLYADGFVQNMNDANAMRKGLRDALRELQSGDRAALLRSHSVGKDAIELTDDLRRIETALMPGRANSSGRGDRLYDAVIAAVQLFPKPYERGRRRAIVAVTDDIETKSKANLDGVITELLEADAFLNAAIIVTGQMYVGVTARTIPIPGIPSGKSRRFGGTNPSGDSIEPAVEATGGEIIPGDKFADEFPLMLRRIRNRYLLGFYAPAATERAFRKIEVKLTDQAKARYPNAAVRARNGYYTRP